MSLAFHVYWSVRSPYSYMVTKRLYELQRDYNVSCSVKAVYPHALRAPNLAKSRNEKWIEYFKTDIMRTAAYLGLPMTWPNPDPVAVDPNTGAPQKDQSRAQRLTRLICAAEERGVGIDFIHALTGLLWNPETSDWSEGDKLEATMKRAGIDLSALDAAIASHPHKYEELICENQRQELKDGHWGVPVMVFEGEPFFGQDRFDQLVWRMKQRGLAPRKKDGAS